MAADSVYLQQVNIVGKQVMKPVEGLWQNVFYFTFGRQYTAPDGLTYPVYNDRRAGMRMLTGAPPDLGSKAGLNTVYKGVKSGLPYIGNHSTY